LFELTAKYQKTLLKLDDNNENMQLCTALDSKEYTTKQIGNVPANERCIWHIRFWWS